MALHILIAPRLKHVFCLGHSAAFELMQSSWFNRLLLYAWKHNSEYLGLRILYLHIAVSAHQLDVFVLCYFYWLFLIYWVHINSYYHLPYFYFPLLDRIPLLSVILIEYFLTYWVDCTVSLTLTTNDKTRMLFEWWFSFLLSV